MSIFDIFKRKRKDNGVDSVINKKNKDLESLILSFEKNEIIMEVNEENEKISPSTSKIGGKPWLPTGFTWPVFMDEDDEIVRPLTFLCQINLADVKKYDTEGLLPDSGMLYFFYECESSRWGFDSKDNGCARVFYFEDTEHFIAMDLPNEISNENAVPEMAVHFRPKKSYPQFEEFCVLSDIECDFEDYDECLEKMGVNEDSECHKFLGYANIIQDEMLTDCARVSRELCCGGAASYQRTSEEEDGIQSDAKEWVLLLQLSTLEKEKWELMWGDCGRLYFYIRKQDLIDKRFENAWFSLQCT